MDKYRRYDQCIADCATLLMDKMADKSEIVLEDFDPFFVDDKCMAHIADIAGVYTGKPVKVNCSRWKFVLWMMTDHWARKHVERTDARGVSTVDIFGVWLNANLLALDEFGLLKFIYDEYYKQLEKRPKKVKKGAKVKSC